MNYLRGTNDTLPYKCFANNVTAGIASIALSGNASNTALPEIWAKANYFDLSCNATQYKTGSLTGTAYTARDVMQIVDALGDKDNKLRYWGVSYGTLLGTTINAMFPDRVDKLIVDGVVNPFEYYENM